MINITAAGLSAPSIIQPLRPSGDGWTKLDTPTALYSMGYPSEAWQHKDGLCVISAVEVMADENKGPEYHVSVSKWGKSRADTNECNWVLAQFQLEGSEEDNHVVSGIVRNFWRTVAEPLIGLECECKEYEPKICENKGDFVWRPVKGM